MPLQHERQQEDNEKHKDKYCYYHLFKVRISIVLEVSAIVGTETIMTIILAKAIGSSSSSNCCCCGLSSSDVGVRGSTVPRSPASDGTIVISLNGSVPIPSRALALKGEGCWCALPAGALSKALQNSTVVRLRLQNGAQEIPSARHTQS